MYKPHPNEIATTPPTIMTARAHMACGIDNTSSENRIASGITMALQMVPNPGRSRTKDQHAKTPRLTKNVAQSTEMPAFLPMPCDSTVHGVLPRFPLIRSASPHPKITRPTRRRVIDNGVGRHRIFQSPVVVTGTVCVVMAVSLSGQRNHRDGYTGHDERTDLNSAHPFVQYEPSE